MFTSPDIVIDDFTEAAPSLYLPSAPTVSYGPTPVVPAVGTVALPDDPVLVDVALPTFLSLNTPTFGGVDLHYDYLNKLENIPTLELVQPTPYHYARGPEYASALLDNPVFNRTSAAENGNVHMLDGQNWYLIGGGLGVLDAMIAEIDSAVS